MLYDDDDGDNVRALSTYEIMLLLELAEENSVYEYIEEEPEFPDTV